MAKKKKAAARQDSRGYGGGGGGGGGGGAPPKQQQQQQQKQQQQQQHVTKKTSFISAAGGDAAPRVVPVTASTHQDLEQLLETLLKLNSNSDGNGNGSDEQTAAAAAAASSLSSSTTTTAMTTTTQVPSDRFFKRVATIYDRLVAYQFTYEQIQQAVRGTAVGDGCGYDITLERTLDWLCLHLSTVDLPPLFTEGQIRDVLNSQERSAGAAGATADNPLVVLAPPTVPSTYDSDIGTATTPDFFQSKENKAAEQQQQQQQQQQAEAAEAETEEDRQEKAAQKAWLLEQYQYVQEEEEDDDDDDKVPEHASEKPITKKTKAVEVMTVPDNAVGGTVPFDEEFPFLYEQALPVPVATPTPPTTTTATATTTVPSLSESEPAPTTTTTTPTTRTLTVEDLRLQALQEELQLCEQDVRDEGANYMRSKYETKELQKRTKNLRKQVQGMQQKVVKQRVQEEKEQLLLQQASRATRDVTMTPLDAGWVDPTAAPVEAEADDGDGDDEMGGMFSMFSEDHQDGTTATTTTTAAAAKQEDLVDENAVIIPKDSIPKSWTGKTPRQILQDWCRKEKLTRPVYQKLPVNGCSVRVKLGPTRAVYLEQRGPQSSYADVQEYMATKALYEITPDLPLYRVLPPYHRDLWRAWMDHEQQEKDNEEQGDKDRRKENIELLVASVSSGSSRTLSTVAPIQKQVSTSKTRQAASDASLWDDQPVVEESWDDQAEAMALESWEDQDDAAHPASPSLVKDIVKSTPADARLQASFRTRQLSANYKKMMQLRMSLPMYSYREEILNTIRANQVTILFAETGAGKTTQCPQFILEEALLGGKGSGVNILCTQPRRVAAMSVAERVADEMCEESIGKLVGYQIRLEAKRSAATRLLFCTTGIILRRLVEDPSLSGISHVVVDEVHERQWQIDVLLVALRSLIAGARPDLKVILMSATLDAELFKSFFIGAPLVSVPGRTFPVATYYLEDLLDATDHIVEEGSRYARRQQRNERETAALYVSTRGGEKRRETVSLDSELSINVSDDFAGYKMSTRRSMERVDETSINYDLIEDVLGIVLIDYDKDCGLVPPDNSDLSEGSVLIFMPGIGEIRTLTERLAGSRIFGKDKFDIVPMHSTLSSTDQRRAFQPARKGCRKIIISTNIAETSVTIPDVVCVIDAGRVREVQRDKRTSTSKLVTEWCSRASGKQRAGRAGRVQPGICLKLFSSRTEKCEMKRASEPELRRIPLEEVCLNILAAGFAKSCMDFLCQTPQPPTEDAVRSALNVLSEIGAVSILKPADETSRVPSTEELTPLGQHLAKLPVDARLGKMLIFGALFRCIDTVLTVAASLSASQSIFSSSLYENQEARAARLGFADPQSDFLSLVNVWDAYKKCNGPNEERKFCKAKFLNTRALREIGDARSHYLDLLAGLGFLEKKHLGYDQRKREYDEKVVSSSLYNVNGRKEEVIHAILCAGLYPNVARFVTTPGGDRSLWHKQERLVIHSSSVNAKTPAHLPSSWVAFHEKFGTSNRVSVSTTCFVHPFSLMIFGGSLVVKHTERKVCLDEWIELGVAAKTGVMFRELRKQVDLLLKTVIEGADSKTKTPERDAKATLMVEGIVQLLENNAGSMLK